MTDNTQITENDDDELVPVEEQAETEGADDEDSDEADTPIFAEPCAQVKRL